MAEAVHAPVDSAAEPTRAPDGGTDQSTTLGFIPGPGLVALASHRGSTNVRLLNQLQRSAGNRAVTNLLERRPTVRRIPDPAAAPAPAVAPAAATGASGLIVDDTVSDPRPDQMRKGDFVTQARAAALAGAQAGAGPLAAQADDEVGRTVGRYSGLSAASIESSVRSEVVGAGSATTAPGLVAAIRDASNNEARSRLSMGVSDSAANAVSAASDAIAGAASAVTNLLFKATDGSTPSSGPGDVARARATMGRGESAPVGLRAEVERITGSDLSDVRMHTGASAQSMTHEFGARAFTVGSDIVVAPGEAAPGTIEGDALLAHELAHAAQQSHAAGTAMSEKADNPGTDVAETAADDVSADAVISRWTGLRQHLSDLGSTVAGRVKSGLRLQRCGGAKIDPKKEELNTKVLEGMAKANDKGSKSASSGIHYPYNYASLYKEDWKKLGEPKDGYADPKYWTRVAFMHWVRKPGVSASSAMKAWFAGPTIADCASVATASEVDALRAALGDDKFDKLFGGEGSRPIEGPDKQRHNLEIGQGAGSSVVAELMRETASTKDAGSPGKRNASPGEWHYFANHPGYAKRHPTGYWQGENALYKGEEGGVQMWTGFGAIESEDGMNKALVKKYNEAQTTEEVTMRKDWYDKYGDNVANWPDKVKRFHGEFPPQIDVPAMLAAGGGFKAGAGTELDPAKVAALKARPDLN